MRDCPRTDDGLKILFSDIVNCVQRKAGRFDSSLFRIPRMRIFFCPEGKSDPRRRHAHRLKAGL
jgi:hypothetical protein